MGTKMDGKALADKICLDLKARCAKLIESGIHPTLTIVTTGDNSASKVYVRNKIKRCEEIGIKADVRHFDYLTEDKFFELHREVDNPIIVQEPITGEVDHEFVAEYLNPVQDVDGFSETNVACLAMGAKPYNYPCTPMGVMTLLEEYNIPVESKKVLVIGRSNIVGRPMAMMLEHEGATVTLAHSKTKNMLSEFVSADIIVSATGRRNILNEDVAELLLHDRMPEQVIIDIGMNRDENGKLCGDFSEDFKAKFKLWTPCPGSTGPMTVAMLMENTIAYYERS